ncbi:MAG: hypothetical protein CR982_07540 [Candidatus Cloacimonadota bacterium]|nr:MAG: hypothetical protein CR982_07540 [Candidatus Cloacimonadota bacterium]PIE80183.1 MAG: hypothetical protein CSA15_02185 [Candidatus Delongbacteria bacterium]
MYNFKSTTIENGLLIQGNKYYNRSGDALISYGYINPIPIAPQIESEATSKYIFRGNEYSSLIDISNEVSRIIMGNSTSENDSIYYDEITVYKYPLRVGSSWTLRYEPWKIDKTVIGRETISIDGEEYDCLKIKYEHDDSSFDNAEYYDYVSDKGLIKREIAFYGVKKADSNGVVIATLDIIESLDLEESLVK